MNKNIFFIVCGIVILDQLTKLFFTGKSFFLFNYTINTGIVFGLFKGLNLLWIIISIMVTFLILNYFRRIKDNKIKTGVAFLLAGTIGNLIDRIVFGYVRDFIDLKVWPIFNIADTFNVIGVLLIVYCILRSKD